ncbi:MAG: RNA polymerase sigma factor [Actinomycetia bacterium]|nr:RNA polymerase sigma factor [Actinomycetes bacterium]
MTRGSPGNKDASRADLIDESVFSSMLSEANQGHGLGFEGLYRWLAPQITRFAAARDAEDPEGITNEVFLRAFRQLERFSGDSNAFRSWIFAIARNQLIDAHRASTRRPQVSSSEIPERAAAGAEVEALDILGSQRVARLLARLSDDQRDVILLRMIGDLSLRQVAAIVDKPLTAVKALQRRGLRRLHDEILAEVVVP